MAIEKPIKLAIIRDTSGTFDWTLFENSNRTAFVRRLQKVGMFNSDLAQLIRPKNWVGQNISQTKSGQQLCSTNVYFD
jgi:hypothetical protein